MPFWSELRRRNVVKVGMAYVIVGWLMIEVASVMGPALNLPEWTTSLVAFLLILGFPVSLVLAWAYELTPDGVKRTAEVPISESITQTTGRKLNYVLAGLLVVVIAYVVVDGFGNGERAVGEVAGMSAVPATESRPGVLANSVAVLPFENLSPDPDNEFFAAGIHEEILSQLVKIRDLNVIARTSVLGYPGGKSIPEIADELNVELVMEGSVRIVGDEVRVTAQLIDGATNLHVWTQTYPGSLDDIFAIQSDIAQRIAMELQAEMSQDERDSLERAPTSSQEAYVLYLKAMALWNGDDTALGSRPVREDVEALLNDAIRADPEFALAYAQRAYMLAVVLNVDAGDAESFGVRRLELEGRALADLATAITLDPALGAAYWTLGRIHQYNWRGAQAETAFARACALSPSDPRILTDYGLFQALRGRFDDALALAQRAAALDPNSGVYLNNVASVYSYAGDLAAAAAASRRAVELAPTYANAYFDLAIYEAVTGNLEEGARWLPTAERLLEGNTNLTLMGLLAYAYGLLGQTEEAARLLRRLEEASATRRVPSTGWIMAYLGVGDEASALEWMRRAADDPPLYEGHFGMACLASNCNHIEVLDRPEFVEARSRLGIQ